MERGGRAKEEAYDRACAHGCFEIDLLALGRGGILIDECRAERGIYRVDGI